MSRPIIWPSGAKSMPCSKNSWAMGPTLSERFGLSAEECIGYFGGISFRFREFLPLARGVSLRVDILTVYDPDQMQPADWVDRSIPEVEPFAKYLYKFKDSSCKQNALVALVKIP